MVKTELQVNEETKSLIAPNSEAWMTIKKKFKDNQIVTVKVSGIERIRSIPELNLFHACCQYIAEEHFDPDWPTKEAVKFNLKIALKFFKNVKVVGSQVFFEPDSLEFTKTTQAKSHFFIKEAIKILANMMKTTPEELVEIVKNRMERHGPNT